MVAGTYKPGVQLLLLQGGDTHIGSSQQPCFLPLASVAISPLLRSAFQESFASPEEPPASPCKELPDQAIPESVQILPVDSSPQDIQVCHSNLLKHALRQTNDMIQIGLFGCILSCTCCRDVSRLCMLTFSPVMCSWLLLLTTSILLIVWHTCLWLPTSKQLHFDNVAESCCAHSFNATMLRDIALADAMRLCSIVILFCLFLLFQGH